MSRIDDDSFFNRPLYKALRNVYNLPIIDHGFLFERTKVGESDKIHIKPLNEHNWEKVNAKNISCRLQKHSVYIQYTTEDHGVLTLEAKFADTTIYNEITPVLVPQESFPPCRERKDKGENEHSFYGHDSSGTEEMTWSWVETKEDNTKEKRQEQLAEYILPPGVDGEGIPHNFCLTNYRLCEVRNISGSIRRQYLITNGHGKGKNAMHLCCGDVFSTYWAESPSLLSSGVSIFPPPTYGAKILGIYSDPMNACYYLCSTLEGFYVIWFRLKTVNP